MSLQVEKMEKNMAKLTIEVSAEEDVYKRQRVPGGCSVCGELYGGKDKESYADFEGRFCGI